MHGDLALLSFLLGLVKWAGAGTPSLRHNASHVSQARVGAAFGSRHSESRYLTSLRTCGELHAGGWAAWVINCGGAAPGQCYPPVCPAGWSPVPSKEKCLIKDWEAPHCEPWTVQVVLSGPTTQTVDLVLPLTIRAYGLNWAQSFEENRPVTLMLSGSSGSARMWEVPMSSGIGDLTINHTVAEYVYLWLVGANYSSSVEMGSLNVTFTPGLTTRYVFRYATQTGTVDAPVRVFVEAQDQYGNLATHEQRGVSITWRDGSTDKTEAILSLAGGVGTALVSSTRPGSYEVSLKDALHSTADVSDTMIVILEAGAASRYKFEVPSSSSYTAGTWAMLSIIAEDQYGNFVPGENRSVTVVASSGATVANGGLVDIVNGRGSVSVRHTVAEIIVVSLQDTAGTGLDVSSTENVRFIAAAAFRVDLSAEPSTQGTVDAALDVLLKAVDQFGNLALPENRSVKVLAGGDRVTVEGGGIASFDQGVSRLSVSSEKPQTVQVSMSDDFGTGLNCAATLSLIFGAGAARKITISAPQSGTVGVAVNFIVVAVDQYGNNASSVASITVKVSTPATATVSNNGLAQLSGGSTSMQVSSTLAAPVTLQLEDTSQTGLDVSETANIVFNAGSAVRYVLSHSSGQTNVSVDSTITVAVSALDAHGNVASSEQRGVGLTTNSSSANSVAVTILNGQGSGQIGHTKPEMLTVLLVDTSNTGLDVSSRLLVRFTAGQARKVRFQSGLVSQGSVDAALGIALIALDQYNNVATGQAAFDVDILASGSQVGGAGKVSLELGRGTATISSQRPQDVEVTIVDSYGTGLDCVATTTLSFTAGAPARVALTSPGSATVGQDVSVYLSSFDQFGNNVTEGSTSISVVVTGAATLSGGGVATLQDGAAVLTIRNTKAESVTLSLADVSASGLDLSSTQTMVFLPEIAHLYLFTSWQSSASVDALTQVTIEARDRYDNLATSCHSDVSVASSKSSSTVLADIDAGRGVAEVGHTIPEEVVFTLVDTQSTGISVAGAAIQIMFTPGAPRSVAMLAAASSSGTVDAPLPVTLRSLDRYGNVATSEQRAVEVRWNSGATALSEAVTFGNGVGQVQISSTRPQNVTVSMADTSNTGLNVSATLSLLFRAGVPTSIAIAAPGSGIAGQAVTVSLKTLDQYGNDADSTSPRVTLQATGSAVVAHSGDVELSHGTGSTTLQDTIAETVQLSMMDTFSTGLDLSATGSIVIRPAPAAKYVFTTAQAQVSVDGWAEISVQAQDQYRNVATDWDADVGAVAAPSSVILGGAAGSSSGTNRATVDISAGSGLLRISHTTPVTAALSLEDTLSTGLDVAGSQAEVIFIAGAARTIVINASVTEGTVDAALMLELVAHDQYGNVAVSENREVTVQAGGSRVSGAGAVQLVQGRGEVRISSELPQTVPVSLSDSASTGIDMSATVQLTFIFGSLYKFRMVSTSDTSYALQKVGRSVVFTTRSQDQFGNLVSDGSQTSLEAEIEPEPSNLTTNKLELALSNGIGDSDLQILEPGNFFVRITDARYVAANGQNVSSQLLTAAVARSDVFQAEFRLDLVPPSLDTLNISALTLTSVQFGIYGLTEPADIWCIAANASGSPPQTPTSISDNAVFTALRGDGGYNVSTPRLRIARTSPSATGTLDGLQSGESYLLRCAVADEFGNQMVASDILKHQLLFQVPVPSTSNSESSGLSTGEIVGIVVPSILVPLLCCCCIIFFLFKARGSKDDQGKDLAKVTPEPNSKVDEDYPSSYPDSYDPHKDVPPAANGSAASQHPGEPASKRSEDLAQADHAEPVSPSQEQDGLARGGDFSLDASPLGVDDEVVDIAPSHDPELLADAIKLEEELLAELDRRGGADADFDSTDSSIESDTSAVLRDVRHFLRERKSSQAQDEELVLPELPLMLAEEEEKRIAALVALSRPGDIWKTRLENFDSAWDGVYGIWKDTRSEVREQQVEFQARLEETRKELAEARHALEVHPETHEIEMLNALAAQSEEFSQETAKHLKDIHQIAVDWPEEDAVLREAMLEEWAPKIRAATNKAERQALRMEATTALRKLDDDRENALDVKLEELETEAGGAIEQIRQRRADAWRVMCEQIDGEAHDLRQKVANLRLQFAELVWAAEDAALKASLKLRREIRDATVEREATREAAQREEEFQHQIADINTTLQGDSEDIVSLRERALKALDRAAVLARRVAMEEKERRKRHWHDILDERGRDRIKAARRAYLDEERRLADEAAREEEDSLELELRRKNGLLLGAQHRAEAASLTTYAAGARGRILMGLQSTAALSVTEERLPRKEKPKGPAASRTASTGTVSTGTVFSGTESDSMATTQMLATPADSMATTQMLATSANWAAAQESAAEELNNAVGSVGDALTLHAGQQRKLLAQRQTREAFYTTAPEGDDEKREDLFDALEENMRRELREARWRFQASAAVELAHRDDGAETELGRRMKAVVRESDHLATEDAIGEKYDRLRAFIINGKQVSMGEIAEAQKQAKALEEEAAQILADAMEENEHADPDAAAEDDKHVDAAAAESEEEQRLKAEARRAARQRRRQRLEQRVKELQEQGKLAEALELLTAALNEEADASDSDWKSAAEQAKLRSDLFEGADLRSDQLAANAEAQRLKTKARHAERQRRREQALLQAQDLEKAGWTGEATEVLGEVLAGKGQESDSERESEMQEIKDKMLAGLADSSGVLPEELEAQRKKIEEMREERRKQREFALARAKMLRGEEAKDVLVSALAEDVAAAEKEQNLIDALISDADRAKLKDALSDRDSKLAEDAEVQRLKAEARRAERQRRREQAMRKANDLEKSGWRGEANEVLGEALAKEGAESDSEWESEMQQVKDKMLAGLADASGILPAELEAQRKKIEEMREERKRRREEALAQAKSLGGEKAKEVLASALAEDVAAAEKEQSLLDALGSEVDRASLKDSLAAGLGQRGDKIAEDAEIQRRRMEARRAERQKRREQAQKQAEELQKAGRVDEALAVMDSAIEDEGAASDSDAEASGAAADPGMKDRMAAGLQDADRALAEELEAQRLKAERAREARRKRREEAKAQAKALQEEGKGEAALDVLSSALEKDAAAAQTAGLEADRIRRLQDEAVAGDADAQRLRMQARRAARLKKRQDAMKQAEDLMKQGRKDEALDVLATAIAEEGDASDADSEQGRADEDELDKLRKRMAAGLDDADAARLRELEEQRLKAEERRAARRKQREEARAKARALQDKGDHQAAMDVLAAALEEEVAAAGVDGSKMKDALAERDRKAAEDAEAQRLKAEARRRQRQQRREEAQRKAQELQAAGKSQEALDLMVAAMQDDGADSDSDIGKATSASLGDTIKLRETLADGLDHREGAVAEESEAQRLKVEARRAARKKKREEAQERAAELEKEAAQVREEVGLGKVDIPDELDALQAWQEESRKRQALGAVGDTAQKAQEEAARRLLSGNTATLEEKSVIKDMFAAEMERCQEVVADEREKQRLKAQQRLDARRQKRKEAAVAEKKPRPHSALRKLKVQNAMRAVNEMKGRYNKRRAKILKEHHEVELRVRSECEAEYRELEERLRRQSAEEIAQLKAKLQRQHAQTQKKEVSDPDIQKRKHESVAKVEEAHELIEVERRRQAERMEKRLAERRRNLQKRQAAVRSNHCQEEVRLQLEQEREKLQKKSMSKVKGKDLMKELYKVKGLVAKLQDPSSPHNAHCDLSELAMRGTLERAQSAASGQRSPVPLPPQPPASSQPSSAVSGQNLSEPSLVVVDESRLDDAIEEESV